MHSYVDDNVVFMHSYVDENVVLYIYMLNTMQCTLM